MTLRDIELIEKNYLTAADVAPFIGVDAQEIRDQAQTDSTKLGFPVTVTKTRVHIPKEGFIFFYRYGRSIQAQEVK